MRLAHFLCLGTFLAACGSASGSPVEAPVNGTILSIQETKTIDFTAAPAKETKWGRLWYGDFGWELGYRPELQKFPSVRYEPASHGWRSNLNSVEADAYAQLTRWYWVATGNWQVGKKHVVSASVPVTIGNWHQPSGEPGTTQIWGYGGIELSCSNAPGVKQYQPYGDIAKPAGAFIAANPVVMQVQLEVPAGTNCGTVVLRQFVDGISASYGALALSVVEVGDHF